MTRTRYLSYTLLIGILLLAGVIYSVVILSGLTLYERLTGNEVLT